MPPWTTIEVFPGITISYSGCEPAIYNVGPRPQALAERDPNMYYLGDVAPRPRVLAERDPNAMQVPRRPSDKPKQKRTSAKDLFEQRPFSGQYEYLCVRRVHCGSEEEQNGSDEEDTCMMLRETRDLLEKYHRLASYCDPDNFDLYISNDAYGYGIIELLENLLKSSMTPMARSPNIHQTWSIIATLGHFLNSDIHSGIWLNVDDGARVESLCGLIGCAILTALNHIERVGQLIADSEFRDLGLVMALYLQFSQEAASTMFDEKGIWIDWQHMLVAYALKADIDLEYQGLEGISEILESLDVEDDALDGKVTATRWSWKEVHAEYRDEHADMSTIGGSRHNILLWSRDKRAEYHPNKKDPMFYFQPEEMRGTKLVVPDCIFEREEEERMKRERFEEENKELFEKWDRFLIGLGEDPEDVMFHL